MERLTEALAPVTGFERLCPVREADGSLRESYEPVPGRTINLSERIRRDKECLLKENETKGGAAEPGDRGLRLVDVYDKKVSMEQFLSQLSDEELACICLLYTSRQEAEDYCRKQRKIRDFLREKEMCIRDRIFIFAKKSLL